MADHALLARLLRFADDAALRADRPAIAAASHTPSSVERAAPVELRLPAADSGAMPVLDAAVLPGGKLLLALGELGARMIGRDGRTVAQIDQPAARLIVSD